MQDTPPMIAGVGLDVNEGYMKCLMSEDTPKIEGIEAEPANAAGVVGYADNLIVSRNIFKNPTCTIIAFAFDEGLGISEHTAPFDAVAQALEGEAEIRLNGIPYNIQSGEIMLLPAHRPHTITAISRFKMILMLIRP
jgi:quercetin dioxygenase-like cupin family protein